jgi:hypothetical protein
VTDPAALTDEELAAMQVRADAATPGPWRSWIEGRDHWGGDTFIQMSGVAERASDLYLLFDRAHAAYEADHDFIAHARTDVPRLIAALRAIRAEVERLREALDFYANPENWEPVLIQAATPGGPNEWASEWISPEAMDGGDIARRALNVPPTLT